MNNRREFIMAVTAQRIPKHKYNHFYLNAGKLSCESDYQSSFSLPTNPFLTVSSILSIITFE